MGLGKFFNKFEENKQAEKGLFNDPARRNELINYDPLKNPLGFLTLGGTEKFVQNFNERREKTINDATASAIQQQAQTRTGYAGVDIQMQNERKKLLNESDLKAQEEELKKRTTFAGSSMQGVMERKKLLGI